MSKLVISILGTPQIEVDGIPVQVDTRKATALLVYLAVTGRTQSRDRLTGLLWPDYDQDRARAALRRTLSTLKKALGDRWVSADRLAVSLDTADVELDLAALRAAARRPNEHGHSAEEACAECAVALETALEQSGSFLQGFSLRDAEPFEEWQSLEAENVEREISSALDRLVHAHTAEGRLEAASAAAIRKLALDPLDEPAHRQLMQLLAWRGMRTAALQQYRDCVAVLDTELGVSPLPETTALYEAIAEGSVEPREHPTLTQPDHSPPVQPSAHMLRGRARELDRLLDRFSKMSGTGTVAVVEGEAGIGKTRLAREFVAWASDRGAAVVEARSHEGEAGLPYALVAQVLDQLADRARDRLDPATLVEVARLVPRLQPSGLTPLPIDDPGALSRFFEAVRKVLVESLTGPRPGVVFLDDLHWCDVASLEVLAYISRRLDETPVFFVAAWRSEEVDQDHPLRKLAVEAGRVGAAATLPLERLEAGDVRGLIEDATGLTGEAVGTMTSRLMEETEGIPFFVVEYLAARPPGADTETQDWLMPTTIKELLRSRVGSVDQTARQILGTAAVIDRSFDFDTVWRASGRTELETVDALDELVHHGLIVAHAGPASQAVYEFSHEKLRSYVYGSLSPARRRVLHRRVADALLTVARRPDQIRTLSGLIARHLELGGMEAEAASYHETAASRARDIFANREALEHYLSALALGHPDLAALHEGAGDMYVLLGRYGKAIDSYERAAALAGHEAVPHLEHKLGEVHMRRGDWELSRSHLEAALETLEPEGDEVSKARLLATMSFNAHRKGDLDEAAALGRRALEAATASGDDRALAQAQNQLGILENARGDHNAAIRYLDESLRLARELEDASGEVAALNNLALAGRSRGDLQRALELTRAALTICEQQGDAHREAALHNNIADLLHSTGESDAAMEHLKRATRMLAEIGDEPTGPLPEVWKLVEW